MFNLQHTIAAVQTNCNIADARHARDMGLCNYLLTMREFYRWERQIPLAQPLEKGDVSAWISQREIKWDEIEENDYLFIPIDGRDHDPFDSVAINRALNKHGLVYNGGYGHRVKPHFFLARLLRSEVRSGLSILVSGQEYARDMAAPPAALSRNTVFLRMDAMQRWLWGKVEIWGLSKTDGALKATLDCYRAGDGDETKLNIIAEHESETLILHEIGEAMAEPLLGEAWREMVSSLGSRRHELLARAVRDNLADCLSTLPELIERNKTCSLHFYFSNFDGLRLNLFPSLQEAYECWQKRGDVGALHNAIEAGRTHWLSIAQHLLAAWCDKPANAEIFIESAGEHFSGFTL
jgi:hypothetical protein